MSGPLDTLVELATRRCDDAARAVAKALAAQRAAQEKALLLEQYRAEYATRRSDASRSGTDATTLRNAAHFLDKLDAACAQARQEGTDAEALVARAQTDWNEARRTLEGYEALLRRNADRAALRERRVEQRQQDEFAARTVRLHAGDPNR